MKHTIKHCLLWVSLVVCVVWLTGCPAVLLGAGAGIGTVAYIKGELVTTLETSVQTIMPAVRATVVALGLEHVADESDVLTGKVVARSAHGEQITILLTRLTDSSTKLSIRVGVFGDRAVSQKILEEIHQRLSL